MAKHPFLLHPLMKSSGRSGQHSRSSSASSSSDVSSLSTALLVIDFQVGVIKSCADVAGVTSHISALIARARQAGVLVVWVQHEDRGLVRDSAEWAISSDLVAPHEDEPRIYKKYRDSFTVPELEEVLHANRVRHLVITGAQSDFCVRTTAQSAAVRGYQVTVPRDAHTTEDSEYGGVKISAEQIIQHTNAYFDAFNYQPGVRCSSVAHDQVDFGGRL